MNDGHKYLILKPTGTDLGYRYDTIVWLLAERSICTDAANAGDSGGRNTRRTDSGHSFRGTEQPAAVPSDQAEHYVSRKTLGKPGRLNRRAKQEQVSNSIALPRQSTQRLAEQDSSEGVADQHQLAFGKQRADPCGKTGGNFGEAFAADAVAERCGFEPGPPKLTEK